MLKPLEPCVGLYGHLQWSRKARILERIPSFLLKIRHHVFKCAVHRILETDLLLLSNIFALQKLWLEKVLFSECYRHAYCYGIRNNFRL